MNDSVRRLLEFVLVAAAVVITLGSIGFGNAKLSYQVVAFTLVSLLCYFGHQYVIKRLLYLRIHRRRTLVASDSPALRKQIRDDIALTERRVCTVLFIPLFLFAGSIYKGIGIGVSLLLLLAIIVHARRSKII